MLTALGLWGCDEPGDIPRPGSVATSSRSEAFTQAGMEKVIPLRFVHMVDSGDPPPTATYEPIRQSIDLANRVYRVAGVQFHLLAIESYVAPRLSDLSDMSDYEVGWPIIGPQLAPMFPWASLPWPAFPGQAGPRKESDWLRLAVSRYGRDNEIVIFVTKAGGNWSGFPDEGNEIVISQGDLGDSSTFAHEVGHYLGLAHTWEEGGSVDPVTGSTMPKAAMWDLFYQPGAGAGTYFTSQAAAAPFEATLALIHQSAGGSETCSAAVSGFVTCTIGGVSFDTDDPLGRARGLGFRTTVGGVTRYGSNAMSYWSKGDVPGISDSQLAKARRYLRWNVPFKNTSYIGGQPGGPLDGFRGDRPKLGQWRSRAPSHRLDFDHDGLRDLAVYVPPTTAAGTGTWKIRKSSTGYSAAGEWSIAFGKVGDVPVPADYNQDGVTDLAVFRGGGPSGTDPYDQAAWWRYCLSVVSGGAVTHDCTNAETSGREFGRRDDVPLPGLDMDGLGSPTVAVWRGSTEQWFWGPPTGTSYNVRKVAGWGSEGWVPMPGLYDDDEKTDLVVSDSGMRTHLLLSSSSWSSPGLWRSSPDLGIPLPGGTQTRMVSGVPKQRSMLTFWLPGTWSFRIFPTPDTSATYHDCLWGDPTDSLVVGLAPMGTDPRTPFGVVRSTTSGAPGTLYLRGSTAATPCSSTMASTGVEAPPSTLPSAVGDMTGDGLPELLLVHPTLENVRYCASPTYTSCTLVTLTTGPAGQLLLDHWRKS